MGIEPEKVNGIHAKEFLDAHGRFAAYGWFPVVRIELLKVLYPVFVIRCLCPSVGTVREVPELFTVRPVDVVCCCCGDCVGRAGGKLLRLLQSDNKVIPRQVSPYPRLTMPCDNDSHIT